MNNRCGGGGNGKFDPMRWVAWESGRKDGHPTIPPKFFLKLNSTFRAARRRKMLGKDRNHAGN